MSQNNDIKSLYCEETNDHLNNIIKKLIELEEDKISFKEAFSEVYRLSNSIKGDSNALGLSEIGNEAKLLEEKSLDLQKSPENYDKEATPQSFFTLVESIRELLEKEISSTTLNTIDSPENTTIEFKDGFASGMEGLDEIKIMYATEAQEHIENMTKRLLDLEAERLPLENALVEIYRNAHSIKGDSNALGFVKIGEVAHDLESLLTKLQKDNTLYNSHILEELFEYVEKLRSMVDISASKPEVGTSDLPEEVESFSGDEEMISIYITEAVEHIESIKTAVKEFESGRINLEDFLITIYRDAHSVRGDSNALGFTDVGSLAEDFESFVSTHQKSNNNTDTAILLKILDFNQKIEDLIKLKSIKVVAESDFTEDDLENNDFNEDIFAIYEEEAKEHVQNIAKNLLRLEESQVDKDNILREIYRESHSLKGDSNTLGLVEIGELAHEFESLISSLQKKNEELTHNDIDKMFSSNHKIQELITKFGKRKHKKDEKFNPISEDDMSKVIESGIADIKKFYFTEAKEHIDNIDKDILLIESGRAKPEKLIPDVFRRIHSLKGDSFAMGVPSVGEKAHELENYLKILQDKPDMYTTLTSMTETVWSFINKIKELINEEAEKINATTKDDKLRITQSGLYTLTHKTLVGNNKEVEETKNMLLNALDLEMQKSKSTHAQQTQKEDETIRVSVQKIDKIVNLSGELLISKITQDQSFVEVKTLEESLQSYMSFIRRQISKSVNAMELKIHNDHLDHLGKFDDMLSQIMRGMKKESSRFSFLIDELQYDSRNTRMLPASVLTDPLRIVARNTSKKLNKKVAFTIIGESIEIDRFLIEKLKDPLSHIIRNALDHGIETTEQRDLAGKPKQANVIVNITLAGNNVNFEITDDGKGIDYVKIREKAISNEVISKEQAYSMSEEELKQLIFAPGFSTADKITDISGRGVGLDVVRSMIEELNGKIIVASEQGRGTVFKLSLPLTLTTFEGFLVKSSGSIFAIPKSFVLKTISITNDKIIKTHSDLSIMIDDQPVKMIFLSDVLSLPTKMSKNYMVLLLEAGNYTIALVVDEIIESKKMFIKNLGSQLKRIKNFSGTTLLGTGEPVLIVNVADITGSIFSSASFNSTVLDETIKDTSNQKEDKQIKRRVLVVDDSLTTRTLEKNILEFAGFEVLIAKNGLEGKEMVEKHVPDLVISDVEMPKMNGFQLTSWIKKDSPFSNIPVIMVTSLANDEFKKKGIEAGADSYIIKGQFDQKKLIDTINELL